MAGGAAWGAAERRLRGMVLVSVLVFELEGKSCDTKPFSTVTGAAMGLATGLAMGALCLHKR